MSCTLHKFHRPAPLTTEFHHIIPQAWQEAVANGKLYDKRTIELCPSSHRNVHFYIVAMMKYLRRMRSEDPQLAWRAVGVNTRESRISYDALTRHKARGYSLLALVDVGLVGQA